MSEKGREGNGRWEIRSRESGTDGRALGREDSGQQKRRERRRGGRDRVERRRGGRETGWKGGGEGETGWKGHDILCSSV